jgi:hypothetical protein
VGSAKLSIRLGNEGGRRRRRRRRSAGDAGPIRYYDTEMVPILKAAPGLAACSASCAGAMPSKPRHPPHAALRPRLQLVALPSGLGRCVTGFRLSGRNELSIFPMRLAGAPFDPPATEWMETPIARPGVWSKPRPANLDD